MQKRAKQKEKEKEEKGFVLLFVALLSAVILAVGLEGADIAYREINFSTSARAANEAFFAADTGIECALYNDRSDIDSFKAGSTEVKCLNILIPFQTTNPWTFTLSGLGESGNSCANVTVEKISGPPKQTIIISKGYSTGSPSCTSVANNVERELMVNY